MSKKRQILGITDDQICDIIERAEAGDYDQSLSLREFLEQETDKARQESKQLKRHFMTPDQFRAALANLQLSRVGFARIAMVDARTVRRWCDGTRAVPGLVVALLNVIAPLRCPIGVHIVTHPVGVHIVTGGGGGSHPEPLGGGAEPPLLHPKARRN